MKVKLLVINLLVAMLGSACARTKPQTPSNQLETDTVGLALVEMNQRLAEQADNEIAQYVLQCGETFVQNEFGYWYKYSVRTQNQLVQKDQTVNLHYRVALLDSTICEDVEKTVKAGKKQLPPVMELTLQKLHLGESIVLLSPWYLAFGQKGSDNVPPYASVRIEMEVGSEFIL